jgi:hypothetical protein
MTKAVTSVAAMQLVEQGKLQLGESIGNVRAGIGITARIDPEKPVSGVILTQILPFPDYDAVRLYGEFESAVYEALQAA